MPPGDRRGAEFNLEEARSGFEDAGLDLGVGKVAADGLRIEIISGTAKLPGNT